MRDMKKTAKKAHVFKFDSKLEGYDLRLSEGEELKNMIQEGKVYEALIIAFNYGFVLGNRATASGKITKRL